MSPAEDADLLDKHHEEFGLPSEQCFTPVDTLAAIRTILAASRNVTAIVADLKMIDQELAQAEQGAVPFHFGVLD